MMILVVYYILLLLKKHLSHHTKIEISLIFLTQSYKSLMNSSSRLFDLIWHKIVTEEGIFY
jgi:hypothetical protein